MSGTISITNFDDNGNVISEETRQPIPNYTNGDDIRAQAQRDASDGRRTYQVLDNPVISNDTLSYIQRGLYQQPGFFGSQILQNSNIAFNRAASTAANYINLANSLRNIFESSADKSRPRNTTDNYYITDREKEAIAVKCNELSSFGFVPFDALEDFFYILASIDNMEDLTYIAAVTGIQELNNQIYIRNIAGVLVLQEISRIGYLANAVSSITRRFAPAFSNEVSDSSASAYSGQSLPISIGPINPFILSLSTGTRLPASIVACNPNMVVPSYAGKAFFGERPIAIPIMDQLFSRRIAAFSDSSGGAGIVAFQFQNFGSFSAAFSIENAINRIVLGISETPAGRLGEEILTLAENTASVLNVTVNTALELRRSDNAIPFMAGLAASLVQDSVSPFDQDVFFSSWKLASSVGNDIQRVQANYLATLRSSL